ncbi:MAG TPA: hypothetical protein VHW43_10190 [Puia sp.]|nr:hypothetical protein [Puia sp.]
MIELTEPRSVILRRYRVCVIDGAAANRQDGEGLRRRMGRSGQGPKQEILYVRRHLWF